MRKINYIENQIIGNFNVKFVKNLISKRNPNGDIRRWALFKCSCGILFESRVNDVKTGKTKGCNCKKGIGIKKYNYGDLINGIKFIRSLSKEKGDSRYGQRAIFECPLCKNEWESLIGNITNLNSKSCGCENYNVWNINSWKEKCNILIFYKVLLFDKNEIFIKIGITGNCISKRMAVIPYKYKILSIIYSSPEEIFNFENKFKQMFKKNKYKPLKYFGGEGECYGYLNV